jgi:hypothetical protein
MRMRSWMAAMAVAACSLTAAGQNQDTFTPMPLDSGFGPMNLTEPSITPDQIIKEFTAKEDEYGDAYHHYTYRREARVDTIDDDTRKVTGEWYEQDDVTFNPSGARMEKVVFAPPSTLDQGGIMMTPTDLQDIQHNYTFVITPQNLPEYDVKYVGRQKVDEVETYVFDVTPKSLDKNNRRFEGRVWVDEQGLQIVVSNGRMVPDDTRKGHEDLHPPFMTWRQQIDGQYWFPVYTKGEGLLHFASGYGYMAQDVHIRETVKYTDYKRFGSTSKVFYNGAEINKDNNQQPGQQPDSQAKQK